MSAGFLFQHVTVAVVLLALVPGAPAGAAAVSTTVHVSATVADGCEIAGQPGSTLAGATLDFGTRDLRAPGVATAVTPSSGTGALAIRCNSSAATATLSFDMGQNASGNTRRLAAGASYVEYELYQDAAFSQAIGGAPLALGGMVAGQTRNVPIYGRIPNPGQAIAQSASAVTAYTDQISLTLTF